MATSIPGTNETPNIQIDERGVMPRVDPFDPATLSVWKDGAKTLAEGLIADRVAAATHFADGLVRVIADPVFDPDKLRRPGVPAQLSGVLLQPNSAPAGRVQVSITKPFASGPGPGTQITAADGSFLIAIPENIRTAANLASITLSIVGASAPVTVNVTVASLAGTGVAGNIVLPKAVEPLPLSVVDQLGEIISTLKPAEAGAKHECHCNDVTAPAITLGGDICSQVFRSDMSVDTFPYGVLVRLVEPRPSIGSVVVKVDVRAGANVNSTVMLSPAYWTVLGQYLPVTADAAPSYQYANRLPIDQPLSIDVFRNGVAGITSSGAGSNGATVPIAGTLGLGYVVHMAQRWTPRGLALGDLVYSLPLAPGEQQRVAVVDRQATSSVFESEELAAQESQTFNERDDASTRATFELGMTESAKAGSSSWGAVGGFGFAMGPFAIGGGASSSGGNSWASGARNTTSIAAQSSHSSVARAASAKRNGQRVGMRLASASENTEVVTKVITNHNKTRALTMQYWEVLRLFDVRSAVQGVTLVCFVPLDPIRFLPPGESIMLGSLVTRTRVLQRYHRLARHASALRRVVPPIYRKGLAALEEFIADPRATVQPPADAAANIVTVYIQGTFLPFEDVWVTLLVRGGRRLGPYPMPASGIAPIPTYLSDPANAYPSEAELLDALRQRRRGGSVTLHRGVVLPESLSRGDVVGVEFRRQFQPLNYHVDPLVLEAAALRKMGWDGTVPYTSKVTVPAHDIKLTAARLEQEVGGPQIARVKAALVDPSAGINEAVSSSDSYFDEYLGDLRFGTAPEPFVARQLPPELRYSALLEIEKTLQHAIANTVIYSKEMWMSLTPEERVMLLEGYTIGFAGNTSDEASQIPLLACVSNELLGFYGNSMVLPFMIPAELAAKGQADGKEPLTTASVQDALTRFHVEGFSPPVSMIALPTRGVLGEAVLGNCPSAEKIDLTRFWNWKDSPGDEAPGIAPVNVPDASLTAGLSAPSTLSGQPAMINNFSNAPPAADSSLVNSLAQIAGSASLTDLLKTTVTTAESARKDALASAQAAASKAMDSISGLIEAKTALEKAKAKAEAEKPKPDAAPSAPTVTKVEPPQGKPGDALTITGTNFIDGAKASIGGKDIGQMTLVSATSITGTVPAEAAAGDTNVIVTTSAGASATSSASKFTVVAP